MRTKQDLYSYQVTGARFVLRKRYCALFVDMGLGKTIMVLTAIAKLLRAGKITSVVVVAPLRVVYNVWRQEAKLWKHTRGLKFSIVHGSHRQKAKALDTPAHVYLVNVDNLRWLDDYYGKRATLPFDMLVVDESSMFKKVKTVRFGIMRRRAKDFKRRVIMTGTPTPNGLHEIWPQLFIVDRGYHLGRRFTEFKTEYFDPGGYMGHRLVPKPHALRDITEATHNVVMRLEDADWLDLPKLLTVPIWVDMPERAREIYTTLEEDMFIAFEETGTFVNNPHAAALRNRCAQLAGGAIYAEHEETLARVWQPVHRAKTDAINELIGELQGEPPVIAYRFRHEAIRIMRKYPDFALIGKDERNRKPNEKQVQKIIALWNKRKLPGIVAHPASVGHGLNMQHGGRHMIWFGVSDSLELYLQMIRRLRRIGQTRTVMNYLVLTRDTVDEVIYSNILHKDRTQQNVNSVYRDHSFRNYMTARREGEHWLVLDEATGEYRPPRRGAEV